MSTPPRPPLKSIPRHPGRPAAPPNRPRSAAVGDRRASPKASPLLFVLTRRHGDGRYPVAWLHISAPYGAVPTATSWCACGRDRSAVGHAPCAALIDDHEAHRDTCPLRTPQEGRAAA